MTIEISNTWPVMAIIPTKESAPRKESTANLSSRNPEDSVILVNRKEPESNVFWEKGTFIDIYI